MIVRRYPEIAAPKFRPNPSCSASRRPHLVLADPLRPLEIVNLNFKLGFPLGPEDGRERVSLVASRAGIHRRQKRIDFRLIQYVTQRSAASMPRNPIVHYRTLGPNIYSHRDFDVR